MATERPDPQSDNNLLALIEAGGGILLADARGWRLRGEKGQRISAAAVSRLSAKGLLSARPGGGLETATARRAASASARDRRPPPVREEAQAPLYNEAESPLAWLRSRRDKSGRPLLTSEQFAAGERLRAQYERAALAPRVTTAWTVTAGSARRGADVAELTDRAFAARRDVEAALAAVGPELSGILLQVCCLAAGIEQAERILDLPQRSGKAVLRLALTGLARHYGLLAGGDGPRRPRHWAIDGYRPDIPAEESP